MSLCCPYCSNTRAFKDPVPVCTGLPPELTPHIRQCKECGATLNVQAFQPGTPKFEQAQALRLGNLGAACLPA
jgi:primosomal protein N'